MSPWFARRIRLARAANGMSQQELAKMAGCDVKTVRNIEDGRDIYAASYMAMCRALGIDIVFVEPSCAS